MGAGPMMFQSVKIHLQDSIVKSMSENITHRLNKL